MTTFAATAPVFAQRERFGRRPRGETAPSLTWRDVLRAACPFVVIPTPEIRRTIEEGVKWRQQT